MYIISEIKDCCGNSVKPGDFVQLVIGKPSFINGTLKKGRVFKVAYIEDRSSGKDDYPVAFLTNKGNGYRIYNSGVTSDEILKVNYDVKKRRIIAD